MTASELKTRFLIGYEFIANNLAPGYTDDEISGFLNQGMHLLIDELYGRGDIANLAEILVKYNYTLQSCTLEDYGTKAYEPTASVANFRWHVNSKVKLTRTEPFTASAEYIPCEIIDKREADKWMQTSFNKPIIVYPKVIIDQNSFIIMVDSYTTVTTTDGFQLIYIKTPEDIDIETYPTVVPDLHPRLHQKIVDKAIALAMKATDVQRAQAEIQTNAAL